MRRREFLGVLGGTAAAWPIAALAQQVDRVRRIGVLMPESEDNPESQARAVAFERRMQELGWKPGRNLQIDYRWDMGNVEKARTATADLLKLTTDVLLSVASPATAAMQRTTSTIPIVFVAVSEPVAQGFVANLAHPGGNMTGFSHLEPTFGAKWLELLKEIAPRISRVAFMFNAAATPQAALFFPSVEATAPQFTVKAIAAPVHGLEAKKGEQRCISSRCSFSSRCSSHRARSRWRSNGKRSTIRDTLQARLRKTSCLKRLH
jgi:putative ABC transport system substrate-binding protein